RIPASVFDGAPEIKSRIKSKSKSGSLRIVVGVGGGQRCVDTYAAIAVVNFPPLSQASQLPHGLCLQL
ncbi:hypothetical protein, partial [Pseudomonas pergaminensis]